MKGKEALELAILEYEKDLETDENNQWVKNVLKGLKKLEQDLDKLEKLEIALGTLIRKLDIRLTKTENYDTAETYYSVYNENSCEILYPEEYELLKEVLKDE